ncbi:MAG: hypothetical protein AAF639_06960 [Chloroflexota bacterium]
MSNNQENSLNYNLEKEKIIAMISLWLDRSNLKFRQVVGRIQSKGILLSEAALADRLTRRPERPPNIAPNVSIAVVQAFTERLLPCERCEAGEALQFANLTRLPLSQINHLQALFPRQEFEQALQQYFDMPMSSQAWCPQTRLPQPTHLYLLDSRQQMAVLPMPLSIPSVSVSTQAVSPS